MADYRIPQFRHGRLSSLLSDPSVMDGYTEPQQQGLLDPAKDAIGPPSVLGGLLSLDPTDYIGPQTLGKLAAGLKGLLTGGAAVAPLAAYMGTTLKRGAQSVPNRFNQSGQIAWHGSPHKFDKFDLSKIGTGEGAQAQGHGLYLAESPEVAQTYKQSADWRQKTMDQMKYLVDGREVMPKGVDDGLLYHYRMSAPDLFEERISHLKKQHQGSLDQAAYYAEQAKLGEDADRYARMAAKSNKTANRFAEELALAERLKSQKVEAATGQLYKTDIPDEAVARFLDWDKPLSQQSAEVKAFAEKVLAPQIKASQSVADGWGNLSSPYSLMDEMTGSQFLQHLRDGKATVENIIGGGGPAVSGALRQAGIPGIRYLDGNSRPKNVIDKRLYSLWEENGKNAEAAVDQYMRGVHNTPARKQQIRDGLLKELQAYQGTSNFVVFDPEMIRILERNGQATGQAPWKPGEWRPMKDLLDVRAD